MAYYGTYYSILTAVQDSVKRAGTQLGGVVVPVALRRSLLKLEVDSLPLVIVAPGQGGEQVVEQAFNKVVVYEYPVVVALIVSDNRQVMSNLNTYMLAREQIRNQLYQPLKGAMLSGVQPIWDFKIQPGDAIRWEEYLNTNYDATVWAMSYKSSETRLN